MTKNANFDILMPTATVGTKHQIVIPKEVRKRFSGLNPGDQVEVYQSDKETINIKVNPKSWVERTRGLMTEAWKDIDPIIELEKMRNEWEERLDEFKKPTK